MRLDERGGPVRRAEGPPLDALILNPCARRLRKRLGHDLFEFNAYRSGSPGLSVSLDATVPQNFRPPSKNRVYGRCSANAFARKQTQRPEAGVTSLGRARRAPRRSSRPGLSSRSKSMSLPAQEVIENGHPPNAGGLRYHRPSHLFEPPLKRKSQTRRIRDALARRQPLAECLAPASLIHGDPSCQKLYPVHILLSI